MTSPKKIILVNGPSRSGKDTVGEIVQAIAAEDVQLAKFAHTLKCGTHALFYGLHDDIVKFGATPDALATMSNDAYYEDRKNKPLPRFLDLTPREAYIAVSEILMKTVYGLDIFGDLLVPILEQDPALIAVVTDSGFQEEAEVLQERFGAENVFVIRLSRPGCEFDARADPVRWRQQLASYVALGTPARELLREIHDSRSYIGLLGSATVPIRNDGSLDALKHSVRHALDLFSVQTV